MQFSSEMGSVSGVEMILLIGLKMTLMREESRNFVINFRKGSGISFIVLGF